MKFVPAPHQGPDGTIGRLYIDMNARMLINDGQHRRRAIEEALKEKQSLGYESISIVFFRDRGLKPQSADVRRPKQERHQAVKVAQHPV